MDNLEKQQIFDTVAIHLIKQGVQAVDEKGKCLYRGPNGTKCAAGVLFSDEKYELSFENQSIYGIAEDIDWNDQDKIDFVALLQDVHDAPLNWPNIKQRLIQFAEDHLLSIEAIKDL